MGGPGSGRRKGGRGGARVGTKIGIQTSKTPQILANRSGMSLTAAKTVFAKKKQMEKLAARRKAKGVKGY